MVETIRWNRERRGRDVGTASRSGELIWGSKSDEKERIYSAYEEMRSNQPD